MTELEISVVDEADSVIELEIPEVDEVDGATELETSEDDEVNCVRELDTSEADDGARELLIEKEPEELDATAVDELLLGIEVVLL